MSDSSNPLLGDIARFRILDTNMNVGDATRKAGEVVHDFPVMGATVSRGSRHSARETSDKSPALATTPTPSTTSSMRCKASTWRNACAPSTRCPKADNRRTTVEIPSTSDNNYGVPGVVKVVSKAPPQVDLTRAQTDLAKAKPARAFSSGTQGPKASEIDVAPSLCPKSRRPLRHRPRARKKQVRRSPAPRIRCLVPDARSHRKPAWTSSCRSESSTNFQIR